MAVIGGDWKTGKTHLALNSEPIIYFQSLDQGTEGVIEKAVPSTVKLIEYGLTVQPGQAGEDEIAAAANAVWEQFRYDFNTALDDGECRTIVWDTESEAWELLRLARFGVLNPKTGRDRGNVWGPVNAEMDGMIRSVLSSDKNFIMLEKSKDEYKDDKKTGKRVPKGFANASFQAQLVAQTRRVDLPSGSEFKLLITDCRGNPDLNGMEIPNDWETLIGMVHGTTG